MRGPQQSSRETPHQAGGCSQGAILCIFALGGAGWGKTEGYTGLVPKCLPSFGGILGGGQSQPGKSAVKVQGGFHAGTISFFSLVSKISPRKFFAQFGALPARCASSVAAKFPMFDGPAAELEVWRNCPCTKIPPCRARCACGVRAAQILPLFVYMLILPRLVICASP